MAIVEANNYVEKIGETAGQVWQALDSNGQMKLTQLVKEIDAPRDQVMQAIGWLAREEKVVIDEQSRSKFISLAG